MSLKDLNINWEEVDEAGSSRLIPAGGYVAQILTAEEFESREYFQFTYDIAEGEHKGFFANDADRPYTHRFVRSYKTKALPFFKQFIRMLEKSNPGFDHKTWNNEAASLVGLKVGVIIQREDYTNNSGEDRTRMNVEDFASVDDIRNNRFKLPEPKDSREKPQGTNGEAETPQAQGDAASVYDADLPF